jgi:hypothetical protein
MDLRIEVANNPSADLVRDLREWLSAESESLGPADIRERAPAPGALGPVADAIQMVLGSVGALSSVASVIVAWLQYRKPDVELTIFVGDRDAPVRVSALRAQQDPQVTRSELTAQLERTVSPPAEGDGTEQHAS